MFMRSDVPWSGSRSGRLGEPQERGSSRSPYARSGDRLPNPTLRDVDPEGPRRPHRLPHASTSPRTPPKPFLQGRDTRTQVAALGAGLQSRIVKSSPPQPQPIKPPQFSGDSDGASSPRRQRRAPEWDRLRGWQKAIDLTGPVVEMFPAFRSWCSPPGLIRRDPAARLVTPICSVQ